MEPNPDLVQSSADLAKQLGLLRTRSGMSLRDFEIWSRKHPETGTNLSKTTVSQILAGRRLPTVAFLRTFLLACGVPATEHDAWLEARTRLAAAMATAPGPSPEEGTRAPSAESDTKRSRRRREVPIAIAAAIVIGGAIALVVAIALHDPESPDPPRSAEPSQALLATLWCPRTGCATTATDMILTGQLSGRPSERTEPFALIYSRGDGRWFLGESVVLESDGSMTFSVGLGNEAPQRKDRHFQVCVGFFTAADKNWLKTTQMSRGGRGFDVAELPPGRIDRNCIEVTRSAQRP